MTRALVRAVLAAAVVCSTAVVTMAQTTSTSIDVKTFEIIAVDGNRLVVKLPEGTKELTVADDFRFNVNGQQLAVQQLKPGMKGTANVTTRTTVTPVTVTEVKNGTVVQSSAGSIIVRTPQGFRSFTQGEIDKRGVKIMRGGQPAELSDFRPGDQLSATIITSMPPHVLTEREVQATLAANPAAAAAVGGGTRSAGASAGGASGGGASAGGASAGGARPAGAASASATASGGAAPATGGSGARAKTLPKTATSWPALVFASLFAIVMGFGLTLRRRFAHQG